jgi:16S rRNA (cytidine1402-2'-O)-methyltransferase
LYLVATPIGAARDITLRALDILRSADVIAAEDTRTARKLMELHGVARDGRQIIAYHDHNGPAARPRLLGMLQEGRSVAYVSEAGTPMVADPGYQLVRDAHGAGIRVFAAPGASALLSALCVAGLPTDRFYFAGFPPTATKARETFLKEVKAIPGTLVLYESPKRISGLLKACLLTLGDRECALCRELTKKFEETRRGMLSDVLASVSETPPKGEIVLVIGEGTPEVASEQEIEEALREALKTLKVKEAAAMVAEDFSIPRRDAYQMALRLGTS